MKTLLSLLVFLFLGTAHAGFIAEPFVGYESNSIKGKTIASTTESKSTATGLAYGVRLGYSFGQFWLGGDYKGSMGSDDNSSGKTDYTTTTMGALLGYQVNKFNFWAGYGFSDTFTFKSNPQLDFVGTNFKAGFNYQTPHKFNVGVEVAIPKYTKLKTGGVEVDVDQVYSSFDVTSVMFMVSYMFGGK